MRVVICSLISFHWLSCPPLSPCCRLLPVSRCLCMLSVCVCVLPMCPSPTLIDSSAFDFGGCGKQFSLLPSASPLTSPLCCAHSDPIIHANKLLDMHSPDERNEWSDSVDRKEHSVPDPATDSKDSLCEHTHIPA